MTGFCEFIQVMPFNVFIVVRIMSFRRMSYIHGEFNRKITSEKCKTKMLPYFTEPEQKKPERNIPFCHWQITHTHRAIVPASLHVPHFSLHSICRRESRFRFYRSLSLAALFCDGIMHTHTVDIE